MENDQISLARLCALLEQALNLADEQGLPLIAIRISEAKALSKQILLQPDRRTAAASQGDDADFLSDAANSPAVRDVS